MKVKCECSNLNINLGESSFIKRVISLLELILTGKTTIKMNSCNNCEGKK